MMYQFGIRIALARPLDGKGQVETLRASSWDALKMTTIFFRELAVSHQGIQGSCRIGM
jgi:hypothetical protein